jgi:hypothetical protein
MLLVALAGLLHLAATKGDPKTDPAKDDTKKNPATQEAAKSQSGKDRLDLPVPKGQPQKGLKIPIYDPESGKLQMNFEIGVATWVDDDNIKMGGLRIQTFKRDGTSELDIELPDSLFNVKSREVTSEGQVTLKRADFEISGKKMTFNTETKAGKFAGGVRMLIYNLNSQAAVQPAAPPNPADKSTAKKEEKK